MSRFLLFLLLLVAAPAAAWQARPAPEAREQAGPAVYGYRIVGTYPHDPEAFTQGLFWLDGHLYESTGEVGRSTIRRVRLEDGEVLQSAPIPAHQFGEGIVNWGEEIVSITWTSGTGYRWNRHTFERIGEWHYPGEGWGLTQNGADIVMSDGTSELRFLDPATLTERRRLAVTIDGRPLARLNELEWVNGEIFANVWLTGFIVRIDPATGHVTGVIDLRALTAENGGRGGDNVLNGIAWDAAGERLFVTGKNWPRLYQIDLIPPTP